MSCNAQVRNEEEEFSANVIRKLENGKNNRKVKRMVEKEECMEAKGTGRQKKEIPGSKILSGSVFL